ncbi:MAG TPA: endopeptidase La [Dehalococcoidia bacterium]|nr:endopeptidase La [Dehalococcoidia bacterium]
MPPEPEVPESPRNDAESQPSSEQAEEQAPSIPEVLPAIASGPNVLFPGLVVPMLASEESLIKAVDEAVAAETKTLGIFAQQPTEDGEHTGAVYDVGTAANIVRMVRLPNGHIQALLQGTRRIRRLETLQEQPSLRLRVEPIEDVVEPGTELEALRRTALEIFGRIVQLSESLANELTVAAQQVESPSALCDFMAANVGISPDQRQRVLEAANVNERLRILIEGMQQELNVLEVGSQIRSQVAGELDKTQREFILRQQLRAIQRELGEADAAGQGLEDLTARLDAANLPEAARNEADRELRRLQTMSPQSPEWQVARSYLEWLADLPWSKSTEDNLDIERARTILDEDHYGLDKVKERILEFLAVRKLRGEAPGPILCFVGPPGVGKTSLGQSIARAMGRKFTRMSLGGIRDEAEIRGHRRTYIGSMPGRIIQELRRAGVNNPLIMLDEIDKLGMDFRGDPASALLEVLDPAQNHTFTDHYLDVPFDLSHVLFITTANLLDPIPAPLRDRMEVIELAGYTEAEKLQIALRYLVPRQIEANGLSQQHIQFTEDGVRRIIEEYTREAGVRNLEREIGRVCRSVARRVAEGEGELTIVTADTVRELLGPAPIRAARLTVEPDSVGVAIGLAATMFGGDVLAVEASSVPGSGKFTLTGQLGDVMQESARAALTYARMRSGPLGIPDDYFEKHDIHVHVPAGAIPKDGPSAGVTMATALISAVTRRPVRRDVAMTGEITLRGRVMPVGGIKEKVLAAHREGAHTVVLPKDNLVDLEEVPEDVRRELTVVPAEIVDDVLNVALHPETKPEEHRLAVVAGEMGR